MQPAEVVLNVLRERGRKGLPCAQLYRQLFNKDLYLLAYRSIYSNKGAMTPGVSEETADGMSEDKIDQIIEAMRREKYRFSPARRVYIPKKNGKLRPLGMPTWSDKLVGEVVRLLLAAFYDPQFADASHGFRKFQGCHTALREINNTWTGTAWFIEGDISDCFGWDRAGSCAAFALAAAAAGTELDRVLEVLDDGERVVAETGARGFLPELLYARARVHAARGEYEARRDTLSRGLQVAGENQAQGWEKQFQDALAGRTEPLGSQLE